MKITVVQSNIIWGDIEANLARLPAQCEAAQAAGSDLCLLPEMFVCGFSPAAQALAEEASQKVPAVMQKLAQERGLWIGGSLPATAAGGASAFDAPELVASRSQLPTNAFLLCGPQGQVEIYEKLHPFSYAREHEHFAAGSRCVTVQIADCRCTLFICYDLRFANVFWDTAARSDAYLVIANWPQARRQAWSTLLRARAIENQAYVVGCNRVGQGAKLNYVGDSAIIDPYGATIAEGYASETYLHATLDPQEVRALRESFPSQKDRRVDIQY